MVRKEKKKNKLYIEDRKVNPNWQFGAVFDSNKSNETVTAEVNFDNIWLQQDKDTYNTANIAKKVLWFAKIKKILILNGLVEVAIKHY